MASIFDFFSGSATPEQQSGLLGLAAAFNGALGDGSRPVNFGQALAAGAAGMQQGRQQHQDRQREQEQAQALAAIRALQLRQTTGEVQAQERATASQLRIQQAAQAASAGGQFDQDAFLSSIQQSDPLEAIKLRQQLAKAAPKFDSGITWVNGPNGQPVAVRTADDGSIKQLEGLAPREKAELINLGGKSVAVNPFAVTPGQSFDRTATPDAMLSAQTAMRGQNMVDARAREANQVSKAPPGYRFMPDGSLLAIPGGPADPKTSKEGVQKVQDARDVISILDEAEPLLSKSTSSYIGAGADQVARAFGKGTPGGEAAAQLKVLQGALISKMPKMSGPQSDKDVLLYREMAGQIGDPTLPESTRSAAAAQLRTLTEKYLNGTTPAAPKAAGGWSIKKVGQ